MFFGCRSNSFRIQSFLRAIFSAKKDKITTIKQNKIKNQNLIIFTI